MFESQDYRRKRAIPTKYKSLFIIFCIVGVFIHSYWSKKTVETITVDQQTIMFQEINKQSLVVSFVMNNQSTLSKKQKIRIEVYDQDRYLITSTIKYLSFKPGKNIYSEQIRYKQRIPDIDDRTLKANITVQPRKLLW